jgi:hypothetical protein
MDAQTGVRPTVPGGPRAYRRWKAPDVVLALVGLAMIVVGTAAVRLPATVDRVTLVNPTPYTLDIDVKGGPGRAWTPVGVVEERSTQVAEEVLDQGDQWVFRFQGQGAESEELRFTRRQLEEANWTFEIPPTVTDRLTIAGAPPNP